MNNACFDDRDNTLSGVLGHIELFVLKISHRNSQGFLSWVPRSLSLIPSSYSQVCDSSFCFWMLRDNPLSAGLGHKKPLVLKQFPSEFPGVSLLGPRGSFPPFPQQTLKLATLLFVRYCVVTVRVEEWVTFNLKHQVTPKSSR